MRLEMGAARLLVIIAACTALPCLTVTTEAFQTGSVSVGAEIATATPTLAPTHAFTWTPSSTHTPARSETPDAYPTHATLPSFRVLSYNILYGAGVQRKWDSALPPALVGKDRLPELLSFIKSANPDIWGVEEANGWDEGTPPVIQQVANALGMDYYLVKTAGGFHLGLLTKFRILETENLTVDVGRQGALRAALQLPDGERLNVFVAHLDPSSSDSRLCQVSALLQRLRPYLRQRTILIGDMNFTPQSREYQSLERAGWRPVAVETTVGIDQIWATPLVEWSSTQWFHALTLPKDLSDHNPIGAEIRLNSPVSSANPQTPLPSPQPAAIPAYLSETLSGVMVSRSERFDGACSLSQWSSRWKTERLTNGVLEIEGEEPWKAYAFRHREFARGEGVLLRFQYAKASEFEIYLDNAGWSTDRYRRFGINFRADAVQSVIWQSSTDVHGENLNGNLSVRPDAWFSLLLAIDKQGEVLVRSWDLADPSHSMKFQQPMGTPWTEMPWVLRVGVNMGKVLIGDMLELSFDSIR